MHALRPDLPTGTVSFLFSDLEASTRLTQELGTGAFRELLERHHEILRAAFAAHEGVERGTQGDAFLVIFRDAPAAVAAAIDAQRGLTAATWPAGVSVRVRMGIHTGEGARGGDDYVGVDVNRAARVASAGHGGQVLLSDATRALAERSLPAGVALRDLGEHRLKDLAAPEHLHQILADGLPSDFPPLRTASAHLVDLPARLTAFVGRNRELAELIERLERTRLLTLTGPGGTGKTSLAVELARRTAADFPDGVWFVPLEGVVDPVHVGSAIAGVLRIPGGGNPTADRLAAYLGDRSVLLILDNFEQVLGAARLVADLVRATTAVRVIVTSRAPLHVSGEQDYPVAPLPIPRSDAPEALAEADSVRLFIDRASQVDPGFTPGDAELRVIAEICERLDGLPLGIELAAAHVRLLRPAAIRDRLADRLDLPGPRSRDLPERQQTLRGAIAWSYDLLNEPAKALLESLSIFAGGFGLDEAEAVGTTVVPRADFLDTFLGLVDQSLVEAPGSIERPRYRLLDTIRRFAGERLEASDRADDVRRAHATAIADLFEQAAQFLPGAEQVAWIPVLQSEHDNHRAAIAWAMGAGETELALRLGASAWRFWQITGQVAEGRATIDRVLAMPGADRPTRIRVSALEAAGGLHYWNADIPGADALYAAQVATAREIGDDHGIADGLFNLAHTTSAVDFELSRRLGQEARDRYLALGDARGYWRARILEVFAEVESGHPEAGLDLMAEIVNRYRESGDDFYLSLAAGTMAGANAALGRYPEAIRYSLESIAVSRRLGDVASLSIGLDNFAMFAQVFGMAETAVLLRSAHDALCARYGVAAPTSLAVFVGQDGSLEASLAQLSPEVAAAAVARGAAMSLDEALDEVVRILNGALESGLRSPG